MSRPISSNLDEKVHRPIHASREAASLGERAYNFDRSADVPTNHHPTRPEADQLIMLFLGARSDRAAARTPATRHAPATAARVHTPPSCATHTEDGDGALRPAPPRTPLIPTVQGGGVGGGAWPESKFSKSLHVET